MKIENRMIEFRSGNRRPDSKRVYELGEAKSGYVPSGITNAAQRGYIPLSVGKDTKEIWIGEMSGVGISLPIDKVTKSLKGIIKIITGVAGEASGGSISTRTELIFPLMSPKTTNIFDIYYDK